MRGRKIFTLAKKPARLLEVPAAIEFIPPVTPMTQPCFVSSTCLEERVM